VSAEVEHTVRALAFVGLDPYHRAGDGGFQRLQLIEHIAFGAGTVLEVDDDKVEARFADHLGRKR
jgi:hypothetical protein